MCASEVTVLPLLKIQNRMPQIVGGVVEESQHGRSNELRAILYKTLSVDALHEYLQTTHRYPHVRAESGESRSQQTRQLAEQRGYHFLFLQGRRADVVCGGSDGNEVIPVSAEVLFHQRQHHFAEEFDIPGGGLEAVSAAKRVGGLQ